MSENHFRRIALAASLVSAAVLVGGGVSKKAEKFLPLLDIRTPIVPAKLENAAGIVGAARLAHDRRVK